jgi:two-component system chemotaxis sensor kinase CheA
MTESENMVKEFLVESYENLDQLDRDLVALEKDPRNRACLASIFRTIHTIKGTCGFFGFGRLESVTHVGENLLSLLRDGQLVLDPERASALLALVDAVRGMLSCIEATGSDGDGDYAGLVERLTRLQEQGPPAASPAVPAPGAAVAGPAAQEQAAEPPPEVSPPLAEPAGGSWRRPRPRRRRHAPAASPRRTSAWTWGYSTGS